MDWFLYDRDLRHERVKTLFTVQTPEVCSYMLQGKIRFWFTFTNIHGSQDSRKRGRLSLYILSTTPICFTDTYTIAGLLLERAHLCA